LNIDGKNQYRFGKHHSLFDTIWCPVNYYYEKCTAIVNVISFIGYNGAASVIDNIRALSFSKAKMRGSILSWLINGMLCLQLKADAG
jgi:hypothetical protein